MPDLDLRGRVALVTGASAGIGRATAALLAVHGVQVVAVARRRENLEDLRERTASEAAYPIRVVAEDLTDPAAAGRLADEVRRQFTQLDILVNAAGGSRTVALDAGDEAWAEAMELNFDSLRRLTHAVLDQLSASTAGRIITITGSSEPARNPVFGNGTGMSSLNAANSAKAAVHAWAKGLSRELGPHGVTVNSVAPGTVLTEQIERIFPTEESRREHIAEHIPMGRFGAPSDVANLVLFLASPLASYITGEVIHVDGGKRRFAF